jgi:membrane protein required for colicin V production
MVVILVMLATLTPLPQDPWWHESVLLPRFVDLAVVVRDLLPTPYGDYFRLG